MLESSLRENGAGIRSDRASERRKNAEALKTMLCRNAAPALLTENTKTGNGYCWNNLFDDVNEFILKECEKFETSRSFENIKLVCAYLLDLIVAGANKDKVYIKCEKVTDSCLLILKSNRLIKAFGDSYLILLYKHVMPYEYYLGSISPETWRDFLSICISIQNSERAIIDNVTTLRLIMQVIKNAINYCQFVRPLVENLSKLQNLYKITINEKNVQEVLVDIAVLLTEELSKEYRLTMCQFTENILPIVIRWYNTIAEHKRKRELFKFLLLTVVIHHPHGRLQNAEASLAFNWKDWKQYLNSVLEIISSEINYLQKNNGKYHNSTQMLCNSFVTLAASVYYLIIEMNDIHNDGEAHTSKKPRLTLNKHKTFNDIIEAFQCNPSPWISIMSAYIAEYGHSISDKDYYKLFTCLEHYITNSYNNFVWKDYANVTKLTIKNLSNLTDIQDDPHIVSLWNACVRYSTSMNAAHETLHSIIFTILEVGVLNEKQIKPLIKLYYEKSMPLTNRSILTLNVLLAKHFSKFTDTSTRLECFSWFINGDYMSLREDLVKEFFLRLISKESLNMFNEHPHNSQSDDLYNFPFNSIDRFILFTEFEYTIKENNAQIPTSGVAHFVGDKTIGENIIETFKVQIHNSCRLLKNKEIKLIDQVKMMQIVLTYCGLLLQNKIRSKEDVFEYEMYNSLKDAMTHMFIQVTDILENERNVCIKIELLNAIQLLMRNNYDKNLNEQIRLCINDNLLYKCEQLIHIENTDNCNDIEMEEDEMVEDKMEMNDYTLRYTSVKFLAAYCRCNMMNRDSILQIILHDSLYNFSNPFDLNLAFECIDILNNAAVKHPPTALIFSLLKSMCKELFRNAKATARILEQLYKMLDSIFCHPITTMRDNCLIMIKGYLSRSEKLYYPSRVVILIYKCMAKFESLNQDINTDFKQSLLKSVNNEIHSLRLYCCYILTKYLKLSLSDIESYVTSFKQMFRVNISEHIEVSLKDEFTNRTATALHCFLTLSTVKPMLSLNFITQIIEIHKTRKLNYIMVQKVLRNMVKIVTNKRYEEYLSKNILQILQYWFNKGHKITELPVEIFGCDNMEEFIERNMRLIVPAELLWSIEGKICNSEIVPLIVHLNKTNENIIEECFSNIIALCLPYVAAEKYKANLTLNNIQSAKCLYQLTRDTLTCDKWSTLFTENIGTIILLTATRIYDVANIQHRLGVDVSEIASNHCYSLEVFKSIICYIGEFFDTNILLYLSKKQSLILAKMITKLWSYVLDENVLELKVLALYRLLVVFEVLPLNTLCDMFICNFICHNLVYSINGSNDKKEILGFTKALHMVIKRLLPDKKDTIEKVIPQIISMLIIKKEEDHGDDCLSLFNELLDYMRNYFNSVVDVVDGSQNVDNSYCSTREIFIDHLKLFISKLPHYSFEILYNIQESLRNNRSNIIELHRELSDIKGFSEDCNDSLIHQLMNALIGIVQTSTDSRIVLQSCNCLAEIGICDLKTLVMKMPTSTNRIVQAKPNQYFSFVVLSYLSEIIFDHNLVVVNATVEALSSLLKYKEGRIALEIGDENQELLKPFIPQSSSVNAKFYVNNENFVKCNDLSVWIPNDEDSYFDWLKKITSCLLCILSCKENYIFPLHNICNNKAILCEKLLPPLIGLVLFYTSEDQVVTISNMINRFFQYFLQHFCNEHSEDINETVVKRNHNLDDKHKLMIQCMVRVVDFIRLQRIHYKKRSRDLIETYNYLNLDYKAVAYVANLAGENIAAIFYGELWCIYKNNGTPPSSPEATSMLTEGGAIQKILQKAFISIGDVDAIDGCGTAHLTNETEKRRHLMRNGQYTDSLLAYDVALTYESGPSTDLSELHHGIVKSLQQFGMYQLAMQYIKSLPDSNELDDKKYDCCSQLGDWSIFVDTADLEKKVNNSSIKLKSAIKALKYACLKDCVTLQTSREYENRLQIPLQRAKTAVSMLFQKLNMDNCQNVYTVISKLQLFKEIEDYCSVRCEKMTLSELIHNWEVKKLPTSKNFIDIETLLAQRVLILEHAARSHAVLLDDIVSLQLNYAELLLANEKAHIAHRFIAVTKKLKDSGQVSLVEGQIAWKQGHKDIALSLTRKLTQERSQDSKLTAVALWQYGNWMVESKYESGKEIIDKYLIRSLEVLGSNGHIDTRLKVYIDIAKFADSEYKQVVAYMISSTFKDKIKCMKNMKESASCNVLNMSKDELQALAYNKKLSTLDEAEIANIYAEKERFLCLAMKYYLLSLSQGEENNLTVFRLISLWLENRSITFNDEHDTVFEELLCAVPSRKFLPVLPQLAPRLELENNDFTENLNNILSKCAMDHPHHTLPILFGLRNSPKDLLIMNAGAARGAGAGAGAAAAGAGRARAGEPRVAAAARLVRRLEADNLLTDIITQMNTMCDALISFANYKTKSKQEKQSIPRSEPISKLKNLCAIPVPTITLPIRNDCSYVEFARVVSFGDYFDLVGGINCPKKMYCKGSDGKTRTVLIKGEDDLRQDAVMQQVFNIVNILLEKNSVTSKNRLLIRTYKVVPLSRRSGILEWCEGTVTLGHYLTGTTNSIAGAHSRYRPMDISCNVARNKMKDAHEKRKSNSEKLAIFLKILTELKPVFHYFFTEHYLDPVTWYERRQAYTKSVATSSMVGYILGLGDRHVQNILIDKKTAEVIHIDFGIAFDKNKALPTPETVPFRLTQDIIAGFGASGVEGVFRRSCEKTMQLLRDNQETLLTILEVLLCDPLYSWSITPGQGTRVQNMTTTQDDSSDYGAAGVAGAGAGGPAQRALLAVSGKLRGAGGAGGAGAGGGAVCVPGQVARLLRRAADAANLCRLFHGWQPYL